MNITQMADAEADTTRRAKQKFVELLAKVQGV